MLTDPVKGYLLGTLSDPDAEQLEREYFADPARLSLLRRKEEELILAYLDGHLIAAEVRLFEGRYCSVPVLLEEVERVRRARNARASKSRRLPLPAFAAAAAITVAAVYVWMYVRPQTQAPSVASVPKAFAEQVLTLPLSPGLQRSAGTGSEISLPRNTTLKLVLEIPGVRGEGPYTVRILRPGRANQPVLVWKSPVIAATLSPTGSLLDVRVSAAVLSPDDYIVELVASNGAVAETYTYRIVGGE